jgi:hypothetical protein
VRLKGSARSRGFLINRRLRLTFASFVVEVQGSGEVLVDDARHVSVVVRDDDAGGGQILRSPTGLRLR